MLSATRLALKSKCCGAYRPSLVLSNIRFAGNLGQHAAEHDFAHPTAVIGGGIDVIHAAIKRDLDAAKSFGDIESGEIRHRSRRHRNRAPIIPDRCYRADVFP